MPPSAEGGRPTFKTLATWMQSKMKNVAPPTTKPPQTPPNRSLLLIDDHHVLYTAGTERVLEPLQRLTPGVPAIAPDEDWETLLGYVSPHRVTPVGGKESLYLYYQCYGDAMKKVTNNTCAVCLATSLDDGRTWVKPKLDVYPGTTHEISTLSSDTGHHLRTEP